MTNNEYWIYLENLRKSGKINMFGAAPYLAKEFNIDDMDEARKIVSGWMLNYNKADYEETETD